MKKLTGLFALTLFILVLSGCASHSSNRIAQISTIDALLAGVYDGHVSCSGLLSHGNFGLGTFNGLDGEMIVLDGIIYQVKADGKVYSPGPEMTTPFATVSTFEAEKVFPLKKGMNFDSLKKTLDFHAPSMNLFCGIKIKGTFATMKTRSVPGQTKPYPPLVDVTRNQPVFNMKNVSGTIVGFRCPSYVKGINVTGYHLHFISDEASQGGHILDFSGIRGEISIDLYNELLLVLPEKNKAFEQTDLQIDRQSELKEVEN